MFVRFALWLLLALTITSEQNSMADLITVSENVSTEVGRPELVTDFAGADYTPTTAFLNIIHRAHKHLDRRHSHDNRAVMTRRALAQGEWSMSLPDGMKYITRVDLEDASGNIIPNGGLKHRTLEFLRDKYGEVFSQVAQGEPEYWARGAVSKSIDLGSEIVENGNFSQDIAGWTVSASGVTWEPSKIRMAKVLSNEFLGATQTFASSVTGIARLCFDVTVSDGIAQVDVSPSTGIGQSRAITILESGSYEYFIPIFAVNKISLSAYSSGTSFTELINGNVDVTFDNVSLRLADYVYTFGSEQINDPDFNGPFGVATYTSGPPTTLETTLDDSWNADGFSPDSGNDRANWDGATSTPRLVYVFGDEQENGGIFRFTVSTDANTFTFSASASSRSGDDVFGVAGSSGSVVGSSSGTYTLRTDTPVSTIEITILINDGSYVRISDASFLPISNPVSTSTPVPLSQFTVPWFVFMPPSDSSRTISIHHTSYADIPYGNNDESWWSANHPDVLEIAIKRELAIQLRNKTEERDYDEVLELMIFDIETDAAMEDMSGPVVTRRIGWRA